MAQNLKLFVNYRQADHADFVGTIRTHFLHRYGRENVFMDFDTIPEFTKFEDFIRGKVRECDALVAIIGPRWIELIRKRETNGQPDYVRVELEEALKHGKVIAPVCIKGAHPPPLDQIPESLHSIFDWQAAELRDGRDILDRIHGIMDQLEIQIAQQGAPRQVENPPTPEEKIKTAELIKKFNVHEALGKYFEAKQTNDLLKALIWLARMRASGALIPDFFNLDEEEANLQAQIKAEEEARRRHEVAEYLYGFARVMAEFNKDITEALQEVWKVEPDYDPDGLAISYRAKTRWLPDIFGKNLSEELSQDEEPLIDPIQEILPAPFEWVKIPAGRVTLITEEGWKENYIPIGGKTFDVTPFAISKYPVTNAQFQVFIKAEDGYSDARWWNYNFNARMLRKQYSQPSNPIFSRKGKHPRVSISWYEAVAFCLWLSNRTEYDIMLPTEQQWQRAGQGDDGRIYAWGNEEPNDHLANWNKNVGQTTPVDHYGLQAQRSPYGLFDMTGNVWEWCLTDYESGEHDIGRQARYRVVRGSSWGNMSSQSLRLAYRDDNDAAKRGSNAGFRLVCSIP